MTLPRSRETLFMLACVLAGLLLTGCQLITGPQARKIEPCKSTPIPVYDKQGRLALIDSVTIKTFYCKEAK